MVQVTNLNQWGDDIDVKVLEKGYASLTPIQYDLTAYSLMEQVKDTEL